MKLGLGAFLLSVFLSTSVFADLQKDSSSDETAKLRDVLKQVLPGETPDSIQMSKIPGLYQVVYGTLIVYVSADGQYIIQGDMFDVASQRNLTEEVRVSGRKKVMESVAGDSLIVFSPPEGKVDFVVNVFTDVDCGYCRRMHQEMQAYLDKGIEIRYLAFPRAGVRSNSYTKIVSVWCADDPLKAMDVAKTGAVPPHKTCENPVQEHMAIGGQMGVSGTPTMVLTDGTVIPGYVPAERLRRMLETPMLSQTR